MNADETWSTPYTQRHKPAEDEPAVRSEERQVEDEPPPRVRVVKAGNKPAVLELDHPYPNVVRPLLMRSLGTNDQAFFHGLSYQLLHAASHDGQTANSDEMNFMLAAVQSIQPRDQVEAMLAAQMAAVHVATMRFARRLGNDKELAQQDNTERTFNKLTRAFIAQLEALKRYRTGGEQKVTVQHVTVTEGGQAIVGNVTQPAPVAPPDQAAASPAEQTDAAASARSSAARPNATRPSAARPNATTPSTTKSAATAVARQPMRAK